MVSSAAQSETKMSLTEKMKVKTKNAHDTSDRMVNMKLALVLTSKELYAEAISLFWPVYRELESLLEKHKRHPQLKHFYLHLETLRRSHLFEKDMAALLGDEAKAEELKQRRIIRSDNGKKEFFDPPELQKYIDNLRELSQRSQCFIVTVH